MKRSLHTTTKVTCGGLLAVLGLLAVSGTWGFSQQQEPPPEPAGLQGMLPQFVPPGLTVDNFAVLGENWQPWSEELADLLQQLYADEPLSIAEQQRLLDRLQSKLDVMQRAIEDPRYRSIREPLVGLHGKLQRLVHVAEAVLATLQQDPRTAQSAQAAQARQEALRAVSELERYLRSIRGGSRWIGYLQVPEIGGALQAGDRQFLEDVRDRIAPNDRLNEVQREFLARPPLVRFRDALDGYLAATQRADRPVDRGQLREALAELVDALAVYEDEALSEAAARARRALVRVRELAPDGGERIMDVMLNHYLNYNFRAVASEQFLNRLMQEQRYEEGPVRDFILGANVYGRQWTTTEAGVDLKPSNRGARFDVTLAGVTQSDTEGVTEQATVFTQGYHRFWAAKEIFYDGERFRTAPARISVDANNTTVGAATELEGVPLLGGIGRHIAVNEARERQPQSEAIAAAKVRRRVLPRFNSEVDQRFQDLNRRLDTGLERRLRDVGLAPETRRFRTTANELRIQTRTLEPDDLAGGTLNPALTPPVGVSVHLHETLLSRVAERMNFAGRTMNNEQMRQQVEAFLSNLLGRSVSLDDEEQQAPPEEGADPGDRLSFAETDPVRFQIEGGQVVLILRAGIQREDEDDIPTQEIAIPLNFTLQGEQIVINRGSVGVSPVESPESPARQIANASVIRRKVEALISKETRDRTIMIDPDEPGERPVPVTVDRIVARDGWLTFWAR